MAFSITYWVTDRYIIWFALGLICFGFIGPGPLGLSPPKYFSSMGDKNTVAIDASFMPGGSGAHIATLQSHTPVSVKAEKNGRNQSSNTLAALIPVKPEPHERSPKKLSVTSAALKLPNPAIKVEKMMVAREFVSHIPTSHLLLSGEAQKASFIWCFIFW